MAYVARLSEILHGSLTPTEIMWELSYADGVRFLNQYHLDSGSDSKLRRTRGLANLDARGIFN